MARLFVNVSPLRESRNFRLLFIGQLVSSLGSQLTLLAIPYQVYVLTKSSFMVGLVYGVQLPLLIVGALWGGAEGDRRDRRSILLVSAIVLALISLGLALNATDGHGNLTLLYVLAVASAAVTGFANPSRNAAIPLLVRPEQLVAAYSLNQVIFQFGSVVGPALSGLLIGFAGLSACYWVDVATFMVLIAATALMTPLPVADTDAHSSVWRSVSDGFSYVRSHTLAQCVYLIDLNAMIFGMPLALFPAMAHHVFHGGPETYGLLVAAPAAGALLGAVTTGWVETIQRRGRAVVLAVALWGACIAGFGFTNVLALALVLLAVAGWADVISAVLRNTILQSTIEDRFRGRLSAIQMAVVTGGPRLGNFEAGGVAALTSVEFSVVSGGLLCIAGAAALAAWRPRFWTYRAEV